MKIGVHDLEFEAPDLAITRVGGDATPDEARAVAEALAAFATRGPIFLLGNIGAPGATMSARARKILVDGLRDATIVAVAAVGGDFKARIIMRLVEAAFRLLSGNRTRMRFFDDEPSARAWLCTQGCVACGATSVPDRSSGSK
ncbi:STAS/SEC14 domain-containing protein [Polyangium spumosum]|uniref:STAS/SEC14 domain-containing protein n=1 Tax=Polyangium spumosum TaxID=889282 RepID=A0A6N7PVQ7_9BACT|nr:STAS/SEC14 domain-containing protein [Polyangium spumosum]MRG94926.1 hypothetical protein [Polyangium spumosum]